MKSPGGPRRNDPSAQLAEAVGLHRGGALDRAEAIYRRIIRKQPHNAGALSYLGTLYYQQKKLEDAVRVLQRSVRIDPNQRLAFNSLGNVLLALQRYEEAVSCFDEALRVDPRYDSAHNNRGNALRELHRFEEAIESFSEAAAINPRNAIAHYNLGIALREIRKYREAIASFEKAFELDPDYPYLQGALLHTRQHICDWRGLDEAIRRLLANVEAGKRCSAPFTLLSIPSSPAHQLRCAEIYVSDKFPPAPNPLSTHRPHRGDRIRIAYFSADFRRHPVGYLIAGLIEFHDRDRFEVIGFYFGPSGTDDMRQRFEAAFDRFIDVSEMSDAEIATLAHRMEIDIAIDMSGFTQMARTGIFTLRPAPIQVTYMGFPGTSGAPYIDYLIADPVVVPPEYRDGYSESIVYMPDNYMVNDDRRPIADRQFTRAELGLPETGFVFSCFNNSFKFTSDLFDIWMRLLDRVEGSVLWLLEVNDYARDNLMEEVRARGVSEDRIVFAPKMPVAEHLARLRAADLSLDTFYYVGHTTTSDALWVGLPVLTCLGKCFASRVAASLLHAIGLPELIAPTPEDYEKRALELATDRQQLRALRARLAENRDTWPCFDTSRFTRFLERALSEMWCRHEVGLDPADITVDPA